MWTESGSCATFLGKVKAGRARPSWPPFGCGLAAAALTDFGLGGAGGIVKPQGFECCCPFPSVGISSCVHLRQEAGQCRRFLSPRSCPFLCHGSCSLLPLSCPVCVVLPLSRGWSVRVFITGRTHLWKGAIGGPTNVCVPSSRVHGGGWVCSPCPAVGERVRICLPGTPSSKPPPLGRTMEKLACARLGGRGSRSLPEWQRVGKLECQEEGPFPRRKRSLPRVRLQPY